MGLITAIPFTYLLAKLEYPRAHFAGFAGVPGMTRFLEHFKSLGSRQ